MMQINEPPAGVVDLEAPAVLVFDLPLSTAGEYAFVVRLIRSRLAASFSRRPWSAHPDRCTDRCRSFSFCHDLVRSGTSSSATEADDLLDRFARAAGSHARRRARRCDSWPPGYGGDPEWWGTVGLLHDFDYERFPNDARAADQEHPTRGVRHLRERGLPRRWMHGDPGARRIHRSRPRDRSRPGALCGR